MFLLIAIVAYMLDYMIDILFNIFTEKPLELLLKGVNFLKNLLLLLDVVLLTVYLYSITVSCYKSVRKK